MLGTGLSAGYTMMITHYPGASKSHEQNKQNIAINCEVSMKRKSKQVTLVETVWDEGDRQGKVSVKR